MADGSTVVTLTISDATFSDGATLSGSFTAEYDAAGAPKSVDVADFTVTLGSDTTVFSLPGTLPYAQPTADGTYKIRFGGVAGGSFTGCGGDVWRGAAAHPLDRAARRDYAGRFVAANPRLLPIRFRRGCLGGGLPQRDLLVSPGHAMFVDGLLVPARCLVDGETIARERGLDHVAYFHLELDSHDIVLAEGAPSETLLDDDSRRLFHNVAEAPAIGATGGFCAPIVDSGFPLEQSASGSPPERRAFAQRDRG